MGVGGHPADGAVHDQAGWTVGGDHYPQLTHGSVAVTAQELGVTSRNWADPALVKLFGKKVINKVRVIKSGLPGRVAVLKRHSRFSRRLGREEDLAWRDGKSISGSQHMTDRQCQRFRRNGWPASADRSLAQVASDST